MRESVRMSCAPSMYQPTIVVIVDCETARGGTGSMR